MCADSRQARPGELFVCVRGLGSDGHAYARAALDAGCVALVVEDGAEVKGTAPAQALLRVRSTERAAGALAAAFYGFPGDKLACVGVTGTNGKTTVSTLIAGMYENLMMGSALIGTVGINVGGEDYPSTHTTPDAVTIQRVLAAAAQADAAAAVMEVSSHALALGRVDEVDFDVAIFTNLTRDHLDFHETEEEYLKAKLKLFERLDDPQRQRAIINVDDPHAQRFIDAAAPVPVITFSMRAADEGSTHADVYLKRDAPIKLYEEELELGEDDPRLEEVDWQGKPLYELVRADEGYEEPPLLLSPEDLADDINEELAKGQTRAETLENSPPEGSPEVDAILQEDAERMHEAQEKFLHTQLEGAARQMNPTAFDPKGQASEYMRYRAVDCKLFDTRVDMWTPSGEVAVLSGLLGHTNVYNLLAAVAFGHTVGFSAPQIEQSIESIDGVPGRFELVDVGEGEQNFAVVVDYAHTPDALERLLKSVRQIEDCARVITVVGCGGDRDRGKRPEMGRIAWENSDMVFFTSDNPRTEEPQWVIDDMLQGIDVERYEAGDDFQNPPDREHLGHICQYFDVVDREDAIRLAVLTANTRDVVVIAGKGHETYIEIGKTKYRFDDREVAANAIRFSEETKEVMPWLRSKWEYPMSYDVSWAQRCSRAWVHACPFFPLTLVLRRLAARIALSDAARLTCHRHLPHFVLRRRTWTVRADARVGSATATDAAALAVPCAPRCADTHHSFSSPCAPPSSHAQPVTSNLGLNDNKDAVETLLPLKSSSLSVDDMDCWQA